MRPRGRIGPCTGRSAVVHRASPSAHPVGRTTSSMTSPTRTPAIAALVLGIGAGPAPARRRRARRRHRRHGRRRRATRPARLVARAARAARPDAAPSRERRAARGRPDRDAAPRPHGSWVTASDRRRRPGGRFVATLAHGAHRPARRCAPSPCRPTATCRARPSRRRRARHRLQARPTATWYGPRLLRPAHRLRADDHEVAAGRRPPHAAVRHEGRPPLRGPDDHRAGRRPRPVRPGHVWDLTDGHRRRAAASLATAQSAPSAPSRVRRR